MDTSETYIKMCEKAEEIQTLWEPQNGGWVWCKLGEKYKTFDRVCLLNDDCEEGRHGHGAGCCPAYTTIAYKASGGNENFKGDHIWLPRQDQLQAIYASFRNENIADDAAPLDAIEVAGAFNDWLESFTKAKPYSWLNNPTDIRGWVQASMERLWLAFLMKSLYSKVWNGTDWIQQ